VSGTRHRALRLVLPGLDDGERPPGLQHGARGQLLTVTGSESVRQALLLLLLTQPGERVNRPDYGCHLNRVLFAPADDTTAGLAIHYVRRAVLRWENRVELLDVDAVVSPESPERLDVSLSYRVHATGDVDTLEIEVPLTAGDQP
jgi:uncharacterized protein